jgi:hypothetical protein
MHQKYRVTLTSQTDPLTCDIEHFSCKTSLPPALEAIFAQRVTAMLGALYAEAGRELLCVEEVDALGNTGAFYD